MNDKYLDDKLIELSKYKSVNPMEKRLAAKVLYSISVNDQNNVETFYNEYLKYTREVIKNFNEDIQNNVMYKYAEYITRDAFVSKTEKNNKK